MAYSKIILNGETLMDVTEDTVDSGNLLSGETATKNSGAKVTGSLSPVTDVTVNGTSVVTSGVAAVTVPDVSGKIDTAGTGLSKSSTTLNHSNSITAQTTQALYPVKIDAQGHISAYGSAVTVPTVTDTYSGTSSNAMSGKAVKSAIDALDGTVTGTAGSGKTLTAFSQTNGVVSATFGDISITKSQVSDFPTIPTITDTYSGTSSNGMSGKAVKSAIDALDGTITGTAGTGKTLTAFSQTDGVVSATFDDISITKSQVSDFPSTINCELIWTNPNGAGSLTSTMGESTITLDVVTTSVIFFLVEFRCYWNSAEKITEVYIPGVTGVYPRVSCSRTAGNPIVIYSRTYYSVSTTQFYFSDCTRSSSNAANVTGSDTGCLVPTRIYKIVS